MKNEEMTIGDTIIMCGVMTGIIPMILMVIATKILEVIFL